MRDKYLKVGRAFAAGTPRGAPFQCTGSVSLDEAFVQWLASRQKVDRAILTALVTLLNGEWIGTGQQESLKMLREALKELEGE